MDQGSGTAPEMIPKLFCAFEEEQKARSFGGLGRLTICRAVVEAHGGTISAHSEGTGRGATFTVRLLVAQCALVKPVMEPRRDEPQDDPGQTQEHALRVLLVEDHPDTAKLMGRLLMAGGHEVVVAGSVAEGLAAAREWKPDQLISDVGLPDGSGLDLMHPLLARGDRIPGIVLSGCGSAADIEKSKPARFAEHLVKPLQSVAVLNAAIARLGVGRSEAGS